MKHVWKFRLDTFGWQLVSMPRGAKPLAVQMQIAEHGYPLPAAVVWMLVDPSEPVNLARKVHVVGTGHEVPEGSEYVGTYQQPPFVWHVFIEPESR